MNLFYNEIENGKNFSKTLNFWNFLNINESEKKFSYCCRIKKSFLSQCQAGYNSPEIKMNGRKKCLDASYEGQLKKIKIDYETEQEKRAQQQDNWPKFQSIPIDKYLK